MLAKRERLALLMVVWASAAIRIACAFGRPSPLLYPDEYLYSALARSVAATGIPTVRGASPHFPALLGPYLMSPAWLVHDVDAAYRIALAWGSLWFSLAAIPAYGLARRLGISARGALLVALLALLVPDAVYTTNVLSEPFAYPTLLAAVLVGVDTLAEPTRRRQVALLALTLALCLIRFQFVVFPAAYAFASLAFAGWSPLRAIRRQQLVAGGLALTAVAVLAVGTHRVVGYYTHSHSVYRFHPSLAVWFVLDAFVLVVAAGWVVLTGACVGFAGLLRGGSRQRAFTLLTLALIAGLLAVAAPYGPAEGRIYERYFFYGAPLIAAAFVWAAESLPRTRTYALLAYAAVGLGLLLPLSSAIRGSYDDMSPTLLGLHLLGHGSVLVWAVGLALLAGFTALRVGRPGTVPLLALAIAAATNAASVHVALGFGSTLDQRLGVPPGIPRLHAARGTAIVTSAHANEWLLMKTLFWNPNVTRVLVLGGGAAPDSFASTDVRFARAKGLVDVGGAVVHGPFAVDSDTFAAGGEAPSVFLFGWSRSDRYLSTVSWLDASAGARPTEIDLSLTSVRGRKGMSFACRSMKRAVAVGARPVRVQLRVPPRSTLTCRISLVGGTPVEAGNRTVSVRAQIAVRELRSAG